MARYLQKSFYIRAAFVVVVAGAFLVSVIFFRENAVGDAQQSVALSQSKDNADKLAQSAEKIRSLEKENAELKARQNSLMAMLQNNLASVNSEIDTKPSKINSIPVTPTHKVNSLDPEIQSPMAAVPVEENAPMDAEQKTVQLKETLLLEGTDDSWRAGAEQEIKYLAVDATGSRLDIISAECRSTLCGIQVIAEKQALDNFINRLTSQLAWASSTQFDTVDDPSGYIKSQIYIGRRELPPS